MSQAHAAITYQIFCIFHFVELVNGEEQPKKQKKGDDVGRDWETA